MALNSTNLPSASTDLVGVFDANFNQVFRQARPIRARVREISRPMEHPVETGVIITDHRIILPVEIEIIFILPAGEYRPIYQQIKQLFISAPLLSVQTRATTYKNMIIADLPHEEDPDLFDTISIALRLKEVQIAAPFAQALPASSVSDITKQSTVQLGSQQPGFNVPMPTPIINGEGSALPQIPGPPGRDTLNTPPIPAGAPFSPAQYQSMYDAANFSVPK